MACAGTGESWTVEQLAEVIKFDHGYTAQSSVVRAAGRALLPFAPTALCSAWSLGPGQD